MLQSAEEIVPRRTWFFFLVAMKMEGHNYSGEVSMKSRTGVPEA